MESYAIIETGGKQYRVAVGDTLEIEHLDVEIGAVAAPCAVLAVSRGGELQIGMPAVADAQVALRVVNQKRGEKVVNFKKKRRKGYQRRVGHRQELTVVKVESIA